jgi:hypothetical protein
LDEVNPMPELSETEVINAIADKIASGEADSGWYVALQMGRLLPVMKQIAAELDSISSALGPDSRHVSIAGELRSIFNLIQHHFMGR